MLRVARIPYLNSVPFYRGFPAPGIELVDLPPRQLGEAARAGRVDAGILSLCDTFDLDGFEPLVPMGIATRGPAHSVLLLTREHPRAIDGVTIEVTTETATSIRLLELVLREVLGVEGNELRRAVDPGPTAAATLLIGDRALVAAASAGVTPDAGTYGPGPVELRRGRWRWMLDLGDAWWRWQRRPFVFARWMVRSDAEPAARAALATTLETSLATSLENLSAVAASAAVDTALPAAAAEAYLRGFRYRFEHAEERAVDAFRDLIASAVPPGAGAATRTS